MFFEASYITVPPNSLVPHLIWKCSTRPADNARSEARLWWDSRGKHRQPSIDSRRSLSYVALCSFRAWKEKVNVPLLVYCVKLLTYCLPTLSGAASGCLHTCSLPKPRTSTVVALLCPAVQHQSDLAAARCAAHLLSTDVYAKCHILYLSCLNCSSLFYVLLYYGGDGATVAAGGGPPSPSQPHVISQNFFCWISHHAHKMEPYIPKSSPFFTLCLLFLNFTPLFWKKKKITIELHLLPVWMCNLLLRQ